MDKPNWFGKDCVHQLTQCERCVPDCDHTHCVPVLIFCNHPDNTDDCEGNCGPHTCPLVPHEP